MDPLFDLVGGMLTAEKHEEGVICTHINGLGYTIQNELDQIETMEEGDEDNDYIME